MSDPNPSLEQQLVAALLVHDQAQARDLATALHARGVDVAAIETALADHPHLEAPLYAVLQAVVPVSRRAIKRRAIRAAEERDWSDWDDGKRTH